MSSLKNTPWQYGVDSDGTCDIYATENKKEGPLRWIGSAIDEETAKAIAALPETLSELERVKEDLEITNEALDQAVYRAVKAEKELEAYKKHIFNSASDKTGSNI